MKRGLVLLLAGFVIALVSAPPAFAANFCVHQGYDWGCVSEGYTHWSACDAETDGQRVFAEAWYKTQNGYYDILTVWDPDGSGGRCGERDRGHIDILKVCETGPDGTFCKTGPPGS